MKIEGRFGRVVELLEDAAAQPLASPKVACLDGLFGDTEALGHIRHAHLLDRAEHEHDAKLVRQRVNGSFRKAAQNPAQRELIIPFGRAGYVALYEIVSPSKVVVLAVRHQREEDYY